MSKTHELKIDPVFFNAVVCGEKKFEIRKNDRGFQVGDKVILREFENDTYKGDRYETKIIYITDYAQKEGYVVFGFADGKYLWEFE